MKPILTLLLVMTLLFTTLIVPTEIAYAETGDSLKAINTIRALGIMQGDSDGNLRLNRLIYRSEFAQMMLNASPFKNLQKGPISFTVFSDVPANHWAAGAVKTVVENGWFRGYLDGTFKPDQFITLEEAASAILKQLGYTASDLSGTYPEAQLNKLKELDLMDGVTATRGRQITRNDALYLFYNLLSTNTRDGRVYGETIGVRLVNGEVDYNTLVQTGTKGPYVLKSGNITNNLPSTMKTATIWLNDAPSSASAILINDVFYYHENLKTVWVYRQKVTGIYQAAAPSIASPTTVTVSGKIYSVSQSAAAQQLSSQGPYKIGDRLTLLIGMNGEIADVKSPEILTEGIVGIITDLEAIQYTDASGKSIIRKVISVTNAWNTTHQFDSDGKSYALGALVSVTPTPAGQTITTLSIKTLSGTVDGNASKIGTTSIANNVKIIDTFSDQVTSLDRQRLSGLTLNSNDMKYYTLNAAGEIDSMILNNLSGDFNTYGVITEVDEVTTVIPSGNILIPDTITLTGTYQTLQNGVPGVVRTNGKFLNASTGGALFYKTDGEVTNLINLGGYNVDRLTSDTAVIGGSTYKLSDLVQVYEIVGGDYYLVTLDTLYDLSRYKVTAYRDSGYRAGNLVRILIAVKK